MEIPDSKKLNLAVISVQHDGTKTSRRVRTLQEAVRWLETMFDKHPEFAGSPDKDGGVIMLNFVPKRD